VALFVVLALTSVAGLFGAHHWTLDLINHFRLYFVVSCSAFAALFWLLSCRRLAGLFGILGLLHALELAPLYLDTPAAPAVGATPLTILHFNAYSQNPRRSEIVTLVSEQSADLVFLFEVEPEWASLLDQLAPQYTQVVFEPSFDNFGIAALARVPTQSARVRRDNPLELATVELQLEWDGAPLTVHALHVYPPVSAKHAAARDSQLLALAKEASAHPGSIIVVGDFNATPWSWVSNAFEESSGLRNAQRGFGYQATWPTHIPIIELPIDASYHSTDLTVIGRTTGPHIGSDHLPVVLQIARGAHR